VFVCSGALSVGVKKKCILTYAVPFIDAKFVALRTLAIIAARCVDTFGVAPAWTWIPVTLILICKKLFPNKYEIL